MKGRFRAPSRPWTPTPGSHEPVGLAYTLPTVALAASPRSARPCCPGSTSCPHADVPFAYALWAVVGRVLEKSGNFGFDAQEEVYGDLVEKGIVDPTKVVRIALQDAASIAGLLITTEAMIADRPKRESQMPAMPGGGMGGMGGMDY